MSQIIKRYHAYLREAGFFPRIEDHEDISFKYQGWTFVLRVHEDDPTFLHLAMPGIGGAKTLDLETACAMNQVNARMKVVKLVHSAVEGEVHAMAEAILPSEDGSVAMDAFHVVLMRLLDGLQTARSQFTDALEAAK